MGKMFGEWRALYFMTSNPIVNCQQGHTPSFIALLLFHCVVLGANLLANTAAGGSSTPSTVIVSSPPATVIATVLPGATAGVGGPMAMPVTRWDWSPQRKGNTSSCIMI